MIALLQAIQLMKKLIIHQKRDLIMIWNQLSPNIISKLSWNAINKQLLILSIEKTWLQIRYKNFLHFLFLFLIQFRSFFTYLSYTMIVLLLVDFHLINIILKVHNMQKKKGEDYNLLPIAQDYFNTIFGEITEMKGLILDSQTSGIISIIYTQSKLYKNDVYLIQKIQDVHEKLMHLKAIYFVRPNKQNIGLIKQELSNPHFKQYHLFFTNEIQQNFIAELAEVDTSDRIKSLQEVYLDYYPCGRNIFSLKIPSTISLTKRRQNWSQKDKVIVNRISDGLISTVMSLRVLPQVKFLDQSDICAEIARKVSKKIEDEQMKKPSDYPRDQRAILIITERKQDVVTPLMTPWTYSAMLHQLFGVYNNKVDIKNKQKAFLASQQQKKIRDAEPLKQKQKRQFVLSQIQDDFFRKNLYSGFGQLASNIKTFINDVSAKRNKTVKLESLEDMHDALSKLPQLNSLSAAVQKHVTLSCEISSEIQKSQIFEVSRIEQDLICQDNRKDNIQSIWKIMKNQAVQFYLKLKLVLLFSIKYPNDKEIKDFLATLSTINPDKTFLSLISLIQQYQNGRKSDLFHSKNFKKKATSYFDRIFSDVPNVYTQHKPYLFQSVIPQILIDRVKQSDYRTQYRGRPGNNRAKPIVILFFVGGVTYTEAKEAEQFEDAKVIVGGTFIHNSKTFISQVVQLQEVESENML